MSNAGAIIGFTYVLLAILHVLIFSIHLNPKATVGAEGKAFGTFFKVGGFRSIKEELKGIGSSKRVS